MAAVCWMQRKLACLVMSLCVTSLLLLIGIEAKSISGDVMTCNNEGQKVKVGVLDGNPCYDCYCRRGRVECDTARCPSLDGCHAILFTRPANSCCDQCKGCVNNGTRMGHGQAWPDVEDPCKVRMCQAGVLTTVRQTCRPTCSHPVPVTGQCCPSCKGCVHENMHYMDGEQFSPTGESGVTCVCQAESVTCVNQPCPVLNCPPELTYQVDGEICPRCKGQRVVFTLLNSCYFAKTVYADGDVVVVDDCTSCICLNGTMTCERTQCPTPSCPAHQRHTVPGECCPTCAPRRVACQTGAVIRKGEQLKKKKGARCPVRQNYAASCSVMGTKFDRIKTFDGLRYRMDASPCLYEFARDCRGNSSFKVRIRYATIEGQRVIDLAVITLGTTKIKLYRDMKVRVNGSGQASTLASWSDAETRAFDVLVKPPLLVIRDKRKGVAISWKVGKRFTVKVSASYAVTADGRMDGLCGLCGDFNGAKSDEFRTASGKRLFGSQQMASAWARGGTCRAKKYEAKRTKSRRPIQQGGVESSARINAKVISPEEDTLIAAKQRIGSSVPSDRRMSSPFSQTGRIGNTSDTTKQHGWVNGRNVPFQAQRYVPSLAPSRPEETTSRTEFHANRGNKSSGATNRRPDKVIVLKEDISTSLFQQLKVEESSFVSEPVDETSLSSSNNIHEEEKYEMGYLSLPKTTPASNDLPQGTSVTAHPATPNTYYKTNTHRTYQPTGSRSPNKVGGHAPDTQSNNNLRIVDTEVRRDKKVKEFSTVGVESPAPAILTQSERSQHTRTDGVSIKGKNGSCDENSVDWLNAQQNCLKVRNWMFFTCAGSINVGRITRSCIDDMCTCPHGDEVCRRRVTSRHVTSCTHMLEATSSRDYANPPSH